MCTKSITPQSTPDSRLRQFILCDTCQHKMFSANASPAPVATATTPRESVFSVSGLPITHSQTGPSVIHIPATAPAPKKPSRPFIKIPPANPQTTRPATKMKTNKVVSTDKPLASRKFTDAGKMSLFATGWSVDKAIKKLASIPHFNSKGEYIVPQFLPSFSEWRQESNMQPQVRILNCNPAFHNRRAQCYFMSHSDFWPVSHSPRVFAVLPRNTFSPDYSYGLYTDVRLHRPSQSTSNTYAAINLTRNATPSNIDKTSDPPYSLPLQTLVCPIHRFANSLVAQRNDHSDVHTRRMQYRFTRCTFMGVL